MANIFEELMARNTRLTESVDRRSSRKKVSETKKIKVNKIKLESRFFLEDVDVDEVDTKFEVGPEDVEEKEDEVVLVIDPEIGQNEEIPEDAAEELVGDFVYKCPVCGANYVCGCDATETEAIEVDEEGVPTECPICGDDAEQILVGQIAPVEDVKEEDNEEMEPVESEEEDKESEEEEEEASDEESEEETEETEEEVIEDSLKNRRLGRRMTEGTRRVDELFGKKKSSLNVTLPKFASKDGHAYANVGRADPLSDNLDKLKKKWSVREPKKGVFEVGSSYVSSLFKFLAKAFGWDEKELQSVYQKTTREQSKKLAYGESKKIVRESDTLGQDVDEFQKWVDYDMKKYGKISGITKGKLAKAGLEVVKDDHGDYEVIAKSFKHEEEACGSSKKSKTIKEDLDLDEIDITDFQEEVPEKCPACKPKVTATLTIDEIRMESLLNKMMKENYKGTPKVKLTKAQAKGSQLKLEYIVFNGKSKIRGVLMAEGFNPKARKMLLKIKDHGAFTESYTKAPAFVVECVVVRNKVIPTAMKYNFTKKVNESLYRVVGKVDNK